MTSSQVRGDFSVSIGGLQVSGDFSVSIDGLQVSGDFSVYWWFVGQRRLFCLY